MCIRKHPYLHDDLDDEALDILTSSDEEILKRAKAEGRDPAEVSKRVKQILRDAVLRIKPDALAHDGGGESK